MSKEPIMNTSKDCMADKEQRDLHKHTKKVLDALANEPFGLSGNQLTTVCRLSLKTVRNVVKSCPDIVEELGAYRLVTAKKEQVEQPQKAAKASVAEKPATQRVQLASIPVHQGVPGLKLDQSKPADQLNSVLGIPLSPEPKRNLQAELLQLLQENEGGLLGGVITNTLGITDKQLGQNIYLLRKTHNINRTGLPGASHYQLISEVVEEPQTETVQESAVVPVTEEIQTEVIPEIPAVQQEIEAPAVDQEIDMLPVTLLDEYKSRIQTVVTRKSQLKLETAQLSELLTDIFGMSKVDWFVDGGKLVGVFMSDEVVT